MQKTDKTFWTTKKERKRSWIFFRSFIFNTTDISIHFKITTINGILFYLKQSTILSKLKMFENENFLIIDSELINKEKELELEKTGFKFFQEKEQKLYFYTPYNRFNLFDIIIKNLLIWS